MASLYYIHTSDLGRLEVRNEGTKIQTTNPCLNPTNGTDKQQLVREKLNHGRLACCKFKLIIIKNSSLNYYS